MYMWKEAHLAIDTALSTRRMSEIPVELRKQIRGFYIEKIYRKNAHGIAARGAL